MSDESDITVRLETDLLILENGLGPEDATVRVRESGKGFGVQVDDKKRALRMIGYEKELPLLLVWPSISPQELLEHDLVIEALNEGAPGVLVVKQGVVLGLLPKDVVQQVLTKRYQVHTKLMLDGSLEGDPIAPSLLRLKCADCGTVNVLPSFVAGKTKCKNAIPNEHLLRIKWE